MASFDEHIGQSKSNLLFLAQINSECNSYWDWQVTTCFYIGVHLVNAHLAKKANLHYRTHEAAKNAINPYSVASPCKIPEEIYKSYIKLENLSRRSRYMCSDVEGAPNYSAFRTKPAHFARTIRHLDKVIEYFKNIYTIQFDKVKIVCPELSKTEPIQNFDI